MATFRFTVGPWNVHEGNETFGPGNRKSVPFEEKIKKFAEIGINGIQFHDDDAVPDMNNMTEKQIIDYAKDVKSELDKYGLFAEFVAPRLWFDKRTNDGGFTASLKETVTSLCGVHSAPATSLRPWAPTRFSCGWLVKAPCALSPRAPLI